MAGSVRALSMAASSTASEPWSLISPTSGFFTAVRELQAAGWLRPQGRVATCAEAQRAVLSALLWRLRVLAGWLPGEGVEMVRALAAWFEIANIEDRLAQIQGSPAVGPFALGTLGVVTRRLGGAATVDDVRTLLSGSYWGDPGPGDALSVRWRLRRRWLRWITISAPEALPLAAAAAALYRARERTSGRGGDGSPTTWTVRSPRGWEGVDSAEIDAERLWDLEAGWWRELEGRSRHLMRRGVGARETVVGAIGVLTTVSQRVNSAFEDLGDVASEPSHAQP